MNKRQASVLIVGLLLGMLLGVFPPRVNREAQTIVASRGCLFSADLYRHQAYDPVTRMGTSVTDYAMDCKRLTIEWAVLAMGVAAVFVGCRTWEGKCKRNE